MYVFPTESFVCIFASAFDGFLGWSGWDQAIATFPNQITSTCFSQGIADLEIILWLEELHHRSLRFAVPKGPSDMHLFQGEWIEAGVVHAGCDVERRGNEVLDLIRFVPVAL